MAIDLYQQANSGTTIIMRDGTPAPGWVGKAAGIMGFSGGVFYDTRTDRVIQSSVASYPVGTLLERRSNVGDGGAFIMDSSAGYKPGIVEMQPGAGAAPPLTMAANDVIAFPASPHSSTRRRVAYAGGAALASLGLGLLLRPKKRRKR